MSFAQGMFEALYGGFETSFKTLPATPTADKIPIINPQFRPDVGWFKSEALSGSPQPRPPVPGKIGVAFSFDVELSKESATLPFKGLFGAPASTTGTTGWHDHYFTLGTMPSMFWEQRHTDVSQNFAWKGCYIGEVQIPFQAEGLCRATFSGLGAIQVNEGSSTIITGTISDKTGELPLDYMASTLKQGGTSLTYGQSCSVRVNRRLDKRSHIDGTNEIGVIFGRIAEVTGTLVTSFQDKALLDLALNGTETSLELTAYQTGTGHGVRIYMPTIKLKPTAPITNDTGLNDLSFDWEAYARGAASNIPGEALSQWWGTGTASIPGLSGLTLVISPDGGANQTVTFAAGDDTMTEVVAAINTQTTLMTASEENGRICIRSDATTGSASSIQVQASSTADTVLGFDNAIHSGFSAQSILVRVSNASATVQA